MVRSFICVEINNPEVITHIDKVISEISQYKGVRVVKSSQLHLTLKFLGEVSETRIESIKQAISQIHIPPFQLNLKGMGCFPNLNYIRVVWIGITDGREPLITLAQTIDKKMISLGFPKEKRAFSPHLTLARIKALRNNEKNLLSNKVRDSKELDIGVQYIDTVILKKSTLTPKGPIYENLLAVPLRE